MIRELSALAEYAGSDPSTHIVTQDSNSAPGLLESQTVDFSTLTARSSLMWLQRSAKVIVRDDEFFSGKCLLLKDN